MDKRMFLAISLSMLVMVAFYTLVPQPPVAPPKPKTGEAAAPAAPGAPATPVPSAPSAAASAPRLREIPAQPSRTIALETPLYTATVDTRGGVLTSLKLKDYKEGKSTVDWGDVIPPLRRWIGKGVVDEKKLVDMVPPANGGALPLAFSAVGQDALTKAFQDGVFAVEGEPARLKSGDKQPATLILTAKGPQGLTVRKLVSFHADSYAMDYEVQVINYGKAALPIQAVNGFGEGPSLANLQGQQGHQGPVYREGGKVRTKSPDDVKDGFLVKEAQWAGITSPFFLSAVVAQTPIEAVSYTLLPAAKEGAPRSAHYAVRLASVNLEAGKMVSSKFKLYLGPKSTAAMEKFGHKLEDSLDLTLDVLAAPMLAMLRWFNSFAHNYGVAIILLTIVVRGLLFPLTYKGMVSMKRMQKLQPKMTALRERFKGDKERMNREVMELYRRYKVNPLSGCLPILLQIPIFFALYSALMGAIELRHAPFMLWINDLSQQDGLYVLPLLMGASMFIQQKLTPSSLDPTQAKIMLWMPVIFTFFMLNFPAGLTLYWFTSNLLSIAQQLVINRVQVPEYAD